MEHSIRCQIGTKSTMLPSTLMVSLRHRPRRSRYTTHLLWRLCSALSPGYSRCRALASGRHHLLKSSGPKNTCKCARSNSGARRSRGSLSCKLYGHCSCPGRFGKRRTDAQQASAPFITDTHCIDAHIRRSLFYNYHRTRQLSRSSLP